MFYTGDLQSAIATAIQQSKLVACFVRDHESESAIWENQFFEDTTLSTLLSEKTIFIRIDADSQEAGFLAAIYPLPKIPALVMMQNNGQLKEYLTAGISKPDFFKRVLAALDYEAGERREEMATTSVPVLVPAEQQALIPSGVVTGHGVATEEARTRETAPERAEGKPNGPVKKEESSAKHPPESKKMADMKYALMQKKRQQDARDERERILKCVEDDKAERRAKEVSRKELATVLGKPESLQSMAPASNSFGAGRKYVSDRATACAIQVRLFDGMTIRSRFPYNTTVRKDVRRWVDSQRPDGDTPYTFKQILTPLPNRTITISEEEETLQSLGLIPTATLVLVPVTEFTSAYSNGAMSYFSRGLSTGFWFISSCVSLVTGTLGRLLGSTADSGQVPGNENDSAMRVTSDRIRIRTLNDQHEPSEQHQLYNGNTLNFEPRKDEDKKD